MMLKDKIIVISGGTSGLGAACAHDFVASGARVSIIGRDEAKAAWVVQAIGPDAEVQPIIGDVSDPEFCEAAIVTALRRWGRIDGLVNSAAVMRRGTAAETSNQDWEESFRVNVSGTFFLCRSAIGPMLRGGGGSIVNVASDWGLVGGKGHVAYCAAKGAVVNMTRALALDHAAQRIRINVVCPGEIRTPMLASGLERRGFAPESGYDELGKNIPIGRVSEPEEQARCIRFLLSDDSSYMTGAVLSVDGGSTTH